MWTAVHVLIGLRDQATIDFRLFKYAFVVELV